MIPLVKHDIIQAMEQLHQDHHGRHGGRLTEEERLPRLDGGCLDREEGGGGTAPRQKLALAPRRRWRCNDSTFYWTLIRIRNFPKSENPTPDPNLTPES